MSAPASQGAARENPTLGGMARSLATGAGLTFLIFAAGSGLGYITQTLLARWLGTEGYGLVSYMISWVDVLSLVAALGLSMSCLRFVPQYIARGRNDLLVAFVRTSYGMIIVSGVLLASFLVVVGGPGEIWTANARVWRIGVWMIPVVGFTLFQMQLARSVGRVVLAFVPRMLLRQVAFLALAGGVLHFGGRLDAARALELTLVSYVLMLLVQWYFLRRDVPKVAPAPRAEWPYREWAGVSASLLLGSVCLILLQRLDVLMLGMFRSAADVGVYNAASKTAGLTSFVLVAINSAVGPSVAYLHAKGDRGRLQDVVRRFAHWTFWPTLAIAIGLAVLGRFILGVFGPEFVPGFSQLVILLLGYVVAAGVGLVTNLLNLCGHQNASLRVYIAAVALNVALNLLLIPRFGGIGAAWATAISMALSNLALHVLAVRLAGINPSVFAREGRA